MHFMFEIAPTAIVRMWLVTGFTLNEMHRPNVSQDTTGIAQYTVTPRGEQ